MLFSAAQTGKRKQMSTCRHVARASGGHARRSHDRCLLTVDIICIPLTSHCFISITVDNSSLVLFFLME